MNFFEHQRVAQKRSKTLVLLFLLAIAALIVVLYFPIQYVVYEYLYGKKLHQPFVKDNPWIWSYSLFIKVAIGTIVFIASCSLYKIRQLAQGGYVIAQLMNGRLIDSNVTEFKEKQLLNVVEEMAIAAGIPAPNVYLMDEENSINAFAAGYTTGDAVIGVTRGTIEQLNRDELQGVIAHEFSHILHGDMRLNIKLIGMLHGILVVSLIGRAFMSSSNNRSSRKGGGQIVLFGLALFLIGWVGYFFAKLIQAAVSRQREFLADASAVQYTRNPEGISNALKKIGGYLGPAVGSFLKAENGPQISHMTFGSIKFMQGSGWMSTHPALELRIRAIDPRFDIRQKKIQAETSSPNHTQSQNFTAEKQPARTIKIGNSQLPVSPKVHYTAATVASLVGTIPAQSIAKQRTWLENMDPKIYNACHHPQKARAVIFVLLAEHNDQTKASFDKLLRLRDPHILDAFHQLWEPINSAGQEARLRLADLAIPSLRQLTKDDFKIFSQVMDELIKLDNRVSMFEYLLMKLVKKHLHHYFYPQNGARVSIQDPNAVQKECALILSMLAQTSSLNPIQAKQAFRDGIKEVCPEATMIPISEIKVQNLHESLKTMAQTSFKIREKLVNACGKIALFDQKVTWQEKELLRLIGDSIDCPIPLEG